MLRVYSLTDELQEDIEKLKVSLIPNIQHGFSLRFSPSLQVGDLHLGYRRSSAGLARVKPWAQAVALLKAHMVAHTYDPRAQEMEAGGLRP